MEVKRYSRRQILGSSKLKEFADDNFKFDENGRKVLKRIGRIKLSRLKPEYCHLKVTFLTKIYPQGYWIM